MANEEEQIDQVLADGIVMLEQILEVMPQDAVALKALYSAYCQSGQRDRAFEYLGKLSDVIYDRAESEATIFLLDHLRTFADEFPEEVEARIARLESMDLREEEAPGPMLFPKASKTQKSEADISEELALAWKLYEENQFSQEEYSSIVHDITEVSTKDIDVPVSILHVLNDRGFNQMNRIMNYMSSRSGVPCVSLLNFEPPEQVGDALPLGVAERDGALPFGFFGNDLLVGVLNPFNNTLVDKVENISGHRCHTYLVHPDEYDTALGKLRSLAKAAEA